jgi:hypothetical protein
MNSITRQLLAVGALFATLAVSSPAHGQIGVGNGMPTGTSLAGSWSNPAYNNSLMSAYGGGYNPYYPGYPYMWWDPFGGFLHGAADFYRGQGDYMVKHAQALQINEKTRQDILDTRRKLYDQWLYERNNTPTLQDLRERDQRLELRRALNDPPVYEIVDGKSLNTLLNKATSASFVGNPPNVPIPADVVRNINVAVEPGSGLGLGVVKGLREGAPLDWPAVLQTSDFDVDRKDLETLLREAVDDAARTGTININVLQKIQGDYLSMSKKLNDNIFHMTADQYLAGRRYLNQLNNSIQALQKKNVEKYFSRLDKVRNVADLVKEMTGQTFAPACPGDESAYLALHKALVAYVMQLQPVLPDK